MRAQVLALVAALPAVFSFIPPTVYHAQAGTRVARVWSATKESVASKNDVSSPSGDAKGSQAAAAPQGGETVYVPKGWDRPLYRAPDSILFEWQELVCCLRFMEEKEVNAALLAPETRAMMIGYAETIMAQGAPVKTYGDLVGLMHGRWKLAFTTEDRYRALPPATNIFYDIYDNGRLKYTLKFKDKIWNALESNARWQLSPQGRLFFEFETNQIKVNNVFDTSKSFNIPLPPNVGNLGTSFSDVSYIDGTLWIEKLRDPGTGNIYFSIFEYVGPCPDQPAAAGGSSQQQ